MTLIQVYRIGPTRQSIQKGFIVDGPKITQNFLRSLKLPSSSSERICLDEKRGNVLWIDTGMIWLHNARAREEQFRLLSDCICEVGQSINRHGGTLFPGAVRTTQELNWDRFLCGDRHFLEINDPVEKEVTCNLIRTHVPTIIAYSGRAGLDQSGLERLGSRRLYNSQEHYAMRYLVSLSPTHLKRVTQCLRRDDGVSKLDFLDINPLSNPPSPENSIEFRFIDSQVYLSTVRAQAILIQALFLAARRLVRDGRRVGNPDQKYLERNRARAISKGLQAQFEDEPDRKERTRKEDSSAQAEKRFFSAQSAWLNLIESLQREFQILEVEYQEIAPLVLGVSLQQMGLAGLRNENDYLQAISRSNEWLGGKWLQQIPNLLLRSNYSQVSPIISLNEDLFPLQSNFVRRWWAQALRFDARKTLNNQRTLINPRDATLNLVEMLKKEDGNPTKDVLRAGLDAFEKSTGDKHLEKELKRIPHPDAQLVWQAYRSLTNKYRLSDPEKGWEDQGARNAINSAKQVGISLLSFTVHQNLEPTAKAALIRLQETVPQGINLFILSYWKYISKQDDTPLLKVEIVLSQPIEKTIL